MLKKDLILQNPLGFMQSVTEDILPQGGFGAVLARAGVGKTALLVQLALNTMLREKNVLHISLNDPVNKVSLWYKELFSNLTLSHDRNQTKTLWESLLTRRFIMTFKTEGFSVPKLEERLTDLMEQGIFTPHMLLIDGLPFEEPAALGTLDALKALIRKHGMHIWFTVRTRRQESDSPEGLPPSFAAVADLFEIALELKPEGKNIHLKALKGAVKVAEHPTLVLDPATLLMRDSA